MSKFIIQGGIPLRGEIEIKGAKNAALPLLASSILTSELCVFHNMPRITDVLTLIELMESLGAAIEWSGADTVHVDCSKLENRMLDYDLVRKLRASILLAGPLLARFGEVKIPYPGGCILGKRPLDSHFRAFEALGAQVIRQDDYFHVLMQSLQPARFYFAEASVTATENILMLASRVEGEVEIRNAACEPHVQNLEEALIQMGAEIDGVGTSILKVRGKKTFAGTETKVVSDQLEVGSFAVAAVVTKGDVTLRNVDLEHIDPILAKFDQACVQYELGTSTLRLKPTDRLHSFNLKTNIWPGFPTDLQAPFTVLATQSYGNSMIHDWMYEGRLFYIDKLISMGADIILCDPHRIIVSGPTSLKGKEIESPDIRAGMALVIAALCAQGESVIDRVELVDRGYFEVEKRLNAIGAKIQRV